MHIATLDILEKASFTPVQAKAIIQAIEDAKANTVSKEAFEVHRQQLATREDFYRLKGELETKIEQSNLKLVQWMVALLLGQMGIAVALFKLFSHA